MKKVFYIVLCLAPSFLYSMETVPKKGEKIILELSKSKNTGKSHNFLLLTKSGLKVVAVDKSADNQGNDNKRISPSIERAKVPYTQFKGEENFGLNNGKK
jgi:hypothetical protein